MKLIIGNGSSLYAVTGHAPRNLDRNITVVGKVMQGMGRQVRCLVVRALLGFYERLRSVRRLNCPHCGRRSIYRAHQPEVFRTDTASFQALVEAA